MDGGAGKGRGSVLLALMKKKQQAAESEDVSTPIPPTSTTPELSSLPKVENIGRGRASLLQLTQTLQQSQNLHPGPSKPPPIPPIGGRGSDLRNLVKNMAGPSTSQSVSPLISAPVAKKPILSGDGHGVLGPLANLAIDEASQTKKDSDPIYRVGESGKKIDIEGNYIDLSVKPGMGLFCYEVKFSPDIDAVYLRRNLLNQHVQSFGVTRAFDGAILHLPMKLPQARTEYKSIHPADGSTVIVTLIFKTRQKFSDNMHFFNNLLRRVMRALDLIAIGRDNYNPRCAHSVPEHRLELWPGYVTAIDEYEGGLKLNINASHRVMRTDTIRDLMSVISRNNRGNFRDAVNAEILGLTVLTRYNNSTYRVDDIEWDKTPTHVFERKGESMSIFDYYKTHWNIAIQDLDQPLLAHRRKEKTPTGETKERTSLLVPELCYLSGLTDKLRADYRVMRDLAKVTQISPEARRNVILRFIKDVKNTPAALEILTGWGLNLADDITLVSGRVLDPEKLNFGNGRTFVSDKADWGSAATSNPMLRTPNMRNWCILATDRDARIAGDFVSMLRRVAEQMSMNIAEPIYIKLKNDRTENYLNEIRKVMTSSLEMVVAICPTNRNDRYAAIKKLCCVESPVRSQVILTKTISRSDKLKSVSEKIALQINCKLGGALWAVKIPFENCMICGVDVFHAGPGEISKGSVAAFVASMDKELTSWYSRSGRQRPNQELVDLLKVYLVASVEAYAKFNGRYPQRIILYRDGVGDGQLATVAQYEVKQLLEAFSMIEPSYAPKLTVIVVQKRINTRLIAVMRGRRDNPPPGTVVDSVVTRRNWYDFFLVPQTARQGTVSPTHYIVIHDGCNMFTDHIQRLSFKLCHLYYNWPGTVRVPAPCQYAHKLAYLVGQSIGMEPSESLASSLYYL